MFAKLGKQDDFAKVVVAEGSDVGDLKKAIIMELKLDVAPNRVRLLREVESGAPVPLDSCEKLATQGVGECAKVLVEVEVMAPPPAPAEHSAYLGARASHHSSHLLPRPLFSLHPLTQLPPRVSPHPCSARAQPLRCI